MERLSWVDVMKAGRVLSMDGRSASTVYAAKAQSDVRKGHFNGLALGFELMNARESGIVCGIQQYE